MTTEMVCNSFWWNAYTYFYIVECLLILPTDVINLENRIKKEFSIGSISAQPPHSTIPKINFQVSVILSRHSLMYFTHFGAKKLLSDISYLHSQSQRANLHTSCGFSTFFILQSQWYICSNSGEKQSSAKNWKLGANWIFGFFQLAPQCLIWR